MLCLDFNGHWVMCNKPRRWTRRDIGKFFSEITFQCAAVAKMAEKKHGGICHSIIKKTTCICIFLNHVPALLEYTQCSESLVTIHQNKS